MRAEGTALVTGAGRGLGRAIALELAARGFDVVATMRRPAACEGLQEAGGGRIRVERLDVDRPETIRIPEGLRVLVNNAGVETAYLPVEHAPLSEWQRVFQTNLFGLLEVTRRAVPELRRSGGGVVCNITSAALLFPMHLYAVYRASKAAVAALGESLAAEVRGMGIRVLEVLPGPIATDMLAGSDRMPEAARHEAYEPLARWALEGRRQAGAAPTSASEAAWAVVDAILDDASPLRVGCDPTSRSLLEARGAEQAEAFLRASLSGMPGDEG